MPEIKHQFTGGKMNKDLDERLVPNGQYRDAMNIQVATSEGSDVGTAQNILGSTEKAIETKNLVGGQNFTLPTDAVCVSAVSDEKNDVMYYLLWTSSADYIVKWDGNSSDFVFVDEDKSLLKFTNNMVITGINVIDDMLFWTDNINEPRKINIPRCIQGTVGLTQTRLYNGSTGAMTEMKEKHITVIKKGPQAAPDMKLHASRELDKIYTALINISSSATDIDGSDASFVSYGNSNGWNDFSNISTETTSDDEFSANRFYVQVYDVLDLLGNEISFGSVPLTNADAVDALQALTGWYGAAGNVVGNIPDLIGKKVVLQVYDEDGTPPGLPLTDFVIKGEVITANSTNGALGIAVTTVDGFPGQAEPDTTRRYVIDLFDEETKLFEFKFPRFSYRYKFEDGEYSTFAPFTQVAFSPGSFDYHPRKGYNIGMTNKLKKVDLLNLITENTPSDVVAIDILFKDDSSPSVYVVDTIRPDDYIPAGTSGNLWSRMLASSADPTLTQEVFSIEREAVSSITPSNQLLRPWDNVPKRALAQDITGNRVVYANYVQNYDLLSLGGEKYVPNFLPITVNNDILATQNMLDPSTNIATDAFKSIKSLREYQLGVVFLDEFGRETPVLSNASGTTRLDKKDGATVNRLGVQFSSDDYPQSLTHFKFYVKETSSEYYNMAMDRWYSAGDGNIWLAFPSSDRNKIDIDTFLILKKGSDQDTLVKEEARYKVLAIESEAPDFIKTTKRKSFSKRQGNTVQTKIFNTLDAPLEGVTNFKMNYAAFHGTSGQDIASTEEEQWIEFGKQGTDEISSRYKINSVTNSWVDTSEAFSTTDVISVELEEALGSDVNFITNGSGLIENGTIIRVYKYKTENLDKFDGRFFVKIYFDEVFRTNIETTTIGGGTRVSSFKKVYSMDKDMVAKHTSDLKRFFTRTRGGTRNTVHGEWLPQLGGAGGGGGIEDDRYAQMQYGYYVVDEFSANALYFRRYREKKYTSNGETSDTKDYGKKQTYSGGGTYVHHYRDKLNNNFNVRALVHLRQGSTTSSKNIDGSDWVGNGGTISGGYKGIYWKDASDWEKEFGYHSDGGQTYKRAQGKLDGNCKGVTSMWEMVTDGNPHSGYATWGYDYILNNANEYYNGPVGTRGSRYKEDQDGYDSDQYAARDTEVWFIDAGPYIGHNNSATGELRWTQSGYTPNNTGNGLYPYTNEWKMDLSFGGIHATNWDGWTAIESFWNIGNWNSPITGNNPGYTDGPTTSFVNNINTGYQLRWKEDVDKTKIYTINGDVTEGSRMRHSDGPTLPEGVASGPWSSWRDQETGLVKDNEYHRDLRSMAEGLSFNLTKKWKVPGITPGLSWNPVTDGEIDGGLTLALECVGMGGSSSTGNTVQGYICSGEFADDLKVFVRDITVVNTTTGLPETLHEGMALTKFDRANGGTWDPLKKLVIREIKKLKADNPGFQHYELTLGGYREPFLQVDHNDLLGGNLYSGGLNNTAGGSPLVGGTMTFEQVGMNGYSPNSEFNINTISRFSDDNLFGAISAVGYTLEFIEEIQPTEVLSENPAIFETEPKDTTALDIYYEACGSIPTAINDKTIASALPIGTKFLYPTVGGTAYTVVGYDGDEATVHGAGTLATLPANSQYNHTEFFRPDDLVITTKIDNVTSAAALNTYNIKLEANLVDNKFILPWHNCYTFKNGVESNRIRDNFNLPYISNGVKASTTLEQEYKEEHRKYGLIYSGIYNSTSGINNLNQFIAAEKITKDINPIYGSIQKLYSRDSDLVTLCEDKILKITANKDALYNADGNPQMIATNRVLGQTIPFAGEYGISTNPESFAEEAYRAYFTDRVRGTVMRLSKDGLTPISDAGMKDWFRDNLRGSKRLLGSYDDRNSEYNLAVNFEDRNHFVNGGYVGASENKVLTFSEKVGGWVSFKSFTDMQHGVSLANEYYTFKNGVLFLHYSNEERNTFYGIFHPSTLDVVLNDDPGSVKVFNTLNYEGSQSKVDEFVSEVVDGVTYNDQEYYNLKAKNGWSVESIITNKEEGYVNEFLEKEGKWFNGINKIVDASIEADTSDFTFQGIGLVGGSYLTSPIVIDEDRVYGCTDPLATNYDATATVDDGSCIIKSVDDVIVGDDDDVDSGDDVIVVVDDDRVFGCTNPTANNYNIAATDDDGSCVFPPPKDTDTKTGFRSTTSNY